MIGMGRLRCMVLLLLLACVVGLAGPAQAQFYAEIPFRVTDSNGTPLENCEVYVWDKFISYGDRRSGVTDASGTVALVLQLYSVSNKDNPDPNIGYLVLPDLSKQNQQELAFLVGETTFFLPDIGTSWGNPAIHNGMPPVTLSPGKRLQIQVLAPDKTPYTGNLERLTRLTINSVPEDVFRLGFDTASYTAVWPDNEQGYVRIYADGRQNDETAASYTLDTYNSFTIATDEDVTTVEIVVEEMSKASVTGTVSGFDPNLYLGRLVFSSHPARSGTSVVPGASGTYQAWLMPGQYFLKTEGFPDLANHYHPSIVHASLDDETRVDIELAPGHTLSGTLQAVPTDDPENPLPVPDYGNVKLNRLIRFDGHNDTVIELPGTWTNENGEFSFPNLEPGRYAICTDNNSYSLGGRLGWVNQDTIPWCSFADVKTGELFELTEDLIHDLKMYQTGSIHGMVEDGDGEHISNYNYEPVQFFVQSRHPDTSSQHYLYRQEYSNKNFFVGFLPPESTVVARFSLQDGAEVYDKFTAPFQVDRTALDLTDQPYTVDPADFVYLEGFVRFEAGSASVPLESGRVFLYGNPMGYVASQPVPHFAPILMQEHGLAGTPQFSFKVEKGTSYYLAAFETTNVENLDDNLQSGFVKTIVPVTIPADAADPFSKDILTDLGAVLVGELKVNGVLLADSDVRIVVHQNYYGSESESGVYLDINPPGVWPVQERFGIVENGQFRISGLRQGEARLYLDFDGVSNYDVSPPFANFPQGQTTPLLARKVFITSPGEMAYDIDFNTSRIGYLSGQLRDDAGEPIKGTRVVITRADEPVFFCTTDDEGVLRKAEGNAIDTSLIPLEPGDYALQAIGVATAPAGFYYDFNESRFFNITSGQIKRVSPSFKRVYPVKLTVKVQKPGGNAQKPRSVHAFVQAADGMVIRSLYVYDTGVVHFNRENGLPVGSFSLWLQIFDSSADMVCYTEPLLVSSASQTRDLTIAVADLAELDVTSTVNEHPLPFASLEVMSQLGSSNFSVGWISTGDQGLAHIFLPRREFTFLPQVAFLYGDVNYNETKCYPLHSTIPIDLSMATAAVQLTVEYQRAPEVKIAIANPPAGYKQQNYLGLLIPVEHFGAPLTLHSLFLAAMDDFHEHPGEQTDMPEDYIEGLKLGTMDNGVLTFTDTMLGRGYIPVFYEFNGPVTKESRWIYLPERPVAQFRYCGPELKAIPNATHSATLPSELAELKVVSSVPGASIPDGAVGVFFTRIATTTAGLPAIPARFGDLSMFATGDETISSMELPPRAYSVRFQPLPKSGFLPKVDENVMLIPPMATHTLQLRSMQKLIVTITNPTSGRDEAAFIPAGAMFDGDIEPIIDTAESGQALLFMPPGPYIGAIIPGSSTYAALYVSVDVSPASDTHLTVTFPEAKKISGKIGVASGSEVVAHQEEQVEVIVFRKLEASSSLDDGLPLYPYPVRNGEHGMYAGVDGKYQLPVEANTDYYLVPMVPSGFAPMPPIRVSVKDSDVTAPDIILQRADGVVEGTLSASARIIVRTTAADTTTSGIGEIPPVEFYAEDPDTDGKYPFYIGGLNRNLPYEMLVYPDQPDAGFFTHQWTPLTWPEPMHIDLSVGYKVSGSLKDQAGDPLSVTNVRIELVAIKDGVSRSFQTKTNDAGQFSFMGIPVADFALVRTESGFTSNGVGYARAQAPVGSIASDVADVWLTCMTGGRVIGKLIDQRGQPILGGEVALLRDGVSVYTNVSADGSFLFDYLEPSPNYNFQALNIAGRVPALRSHVQVFPETTTDLGAIRMEQSMNANGSLLGFKTLAELALPYGLQEHSDLLVIGLKNNSAFSDLDILDDRFLDQLAGFANLTWNAATPPTDLNFRGSFAGGGTNLALFFEQSFSNGAYWRVLDGWKLNVNMPTFAQIGTAPFNAGDLALASAWGSIGGTVRHYSSETGFNPGEAVVALFPVTASGTMTGSPMPTAMAVPTVGQWDIPYIPAGKYRIKIITRQFSTFFAPEIIEVKAGERLSKDLVMGNSVFRIHGKVVTTAIDPDTEEPTNVPLEGVRLVLNGNKIVTTNVTGEFEFFEVPDPAFAVNLLVNKPGYKTIRIVRPQQVLNAVIDLGSLELSSNVATFRATVVDEDDAVLPGAVARLTYRETGDEGSPMVLAGEEYADENGVFVFSNMPTDRAATVTVRLPDYEIARVSVEPISPGETASATVKLSPAPLKVSYQGFLDNIAVDKYSYLALFNFSRPVNADDISLTVNGMEVSEELELPTVVTFCDFSNDNMSLTGDEFDSVLKVGDDEFKFTEKATRRFTKTYEVDPLNVKGFEQRVADKDGTQTSTGIRIPAGMLDDDITEFTITEEVGTGTIELEGGVATDSVAFAGPVFNFDFGKRIGKVNEEAAEAAPAYLFDVTIRYTDKEATNLEPRWYDPVTKTWSKVGILQGSVKWDHPEAGYVTFKVTHLTEFAVFSGVSDAATGLRCDFNGDGKVDLNDVVFLWSYQQLEAFLAGSGSDSEAVNRRAKALRAGVEGSLMYRPSIAADDINGDGVIDLNDVVFLWAWQQLESFVHGSGSNSTNLLKRAKNLRSTVVGSPMVQPNIKISR